MLGSTPLIVLDASALLALVKEPGWDVLARQIVNQGATIGAVNYAEILQKAVRLPLAAEQVDA